MVSALEMINLNTLRLPPLHLRACSDINHLTENTIIIVHPSGKDIYSNDKNTKYFCKVGTMWALNRTSIKLLRCGTANGRETKSTTK